MGHQRREFFLASSVVAIVLAAFLLGGASGQQAPASAPALGRYQMSSFVLQNLTPGAYILDTQTGDLFQVIGKKAPELIGSVAKVKQGSR